MLDPDNRPAIEPFSSPPLLNVLVDTEEEFDWDRPLARDNTATRSVRAQHRAHKLFAAFGIRPTYVIDYPVASLEDGYRPLLELHGDGLCEIGAHLHPWVNPPHDEEVSNFASYPGNLTPRLEREKLRVLTACIEDRFGFRPTLYKAGRYGVGPATAAILGELGYDIDASVVAATNFARAEGPDFTALGAAPYWFGHDRKLLEIPVTVGFAGLLAHTGNAVYRPIASDFGLALHLPGVFARLGLTERIRLSPEGATFAELRRLTRAMLARGHSVFSFTYHSPSLVPGNTPYVRSEGELTAFLDTCRRYFEYFMGDIGGRPATPWEIRKLATVSRRAAS